MQVQFNKVAYKILGWMSVHGLPFYNSLECEYLNLPYSRNQPKSGGIHQMGVHNKFLHKKMEDIIVYYHQLEHSWISIRHTLSIKRSVNYSNLSTRIGYTKKNIIYSLT